jgi:8-amino-7-oxononanoate synthase
MMAARLQKRKSQGLLRRLTTSNDLIDLTSNDYFGFARAEKISSGYAGSTGSRLLTGNSAAHEQLEEQIAEFHRAESCLIFNSGYTANLGLISALGTAETTCLYDLDIHASMIDGMRLSEAKKLPFRHNDLESLEQRLKNASLPVFVLIESLYSISGEFAPIEEIVALCTRYQANLIVDEAHATGICGSYGEGLVCQLNLESQVFARMHTFSKALGAHGACVLGNKQLKEYLINFSRPLIYTTALPSSALAHIAESYKRLGSEVSSHQKRLQHLIGYFCQKSGMRVTHSPILPLSIGSADKARAISQTLRMKGLDVRPIVPPTIGKGKECLRVVLHSFNQESDIDKLIEALG